MFDLTSSDIIFGWEKKFYTHCLGYLGFTQYCKTRFTQGKLGSTEIAFGGKSETIALILRKSYQEILVTQTKIMNYIY